MKRLLQHGLLLAWIAALAACSQGNAGPNTASVSEKVTVPSGTKLRIALIDGVSTTKNAPGDSFMANLSEPVVIDGNTILAKGSKVHGRVTDVRESGRGKGLASIRLTLTDIDANGQKLSISTAPFGCGAGRRKEIHYSPETRLTFRLNSPLETALSADMPDAAAHGGR